MSKVALIIGGSGDIGSAIAQKMARKNIKVYLSYHNKKPNSPLFNFFNMDVTDTDSTRRAFSEILAEQKIDIVVFSVTAKIEHKPLISLQWNDFSKHINVQIKGLFNIVEALKEEIKLKNKVKFIIILTEYCVGKPPSSISHYITAKYGLMGMAKAMAVELAAYNCTVNMVSPGMTSGSLISNLPPKLIEITAANNPLGRIAEPEDIANAVLFLAGNESNYINGANILVNGGGILL